MVNYPIVRDQEDDPELDDECLTAYEKLTRFRKAIEQILGRVKGTESPYAKGPQSSEEEIVVRERVPSIEGYYLFSITLEIW